MRYFSAASSEIGGLEEGEKEKAQEGERGKTRGTARGRRTGKKREKEEKTRAGLYLRRDRGPAENGAARSDGRRRNIKTAGNKEKARGQSGASRSAFPMSMKARTSNMIAMPGRMAK